MLFRSAVIPAGRVRYLAEIASNNREYDALVNSQSELATKWYQLQGTLKHESIKNNATVTAALQQEIDKIIEQLTPVSRKLITNWPSKVKAYQEDFYEYTVRDKKITQPMTSTSLSGTRIPKVVLPKFKDWGDLLRWQAQENVPGHFP